ncbi:MAG TPA: hypothetical protein ENF81_08360 [Thermotogaceae bacterium]|nr:hypothetical protein [Thermotogaceae bacterium]
MWIIGEGKIIYQDNANTISISESITDIYITVCTKNENGQYETMDIRVKKDETVTNYLRRIYDERK